MAGFKIWRSLSASFADVWQNPAAAVTAYLPFLLVAVFQQFDLIFYAPRGGSVAASLLVFVAFCAAFVWAVVRWAGTVMRSTKHAPARNPPYWPVTQALIKLGAVLAAFSMVVFVGVALTPPSEHYSLYVDLWPCVLIWVLCLWPAVRYGLLPFRAAVGMGATMGECRHATRGYFWHLSRLVLATTLLSLAAASAITAIQLRGDLIAAHFGFIEPVHYISHPGLWTFQQVEAARGAGGHSVLIICQLITAPISGAVMLTCIGTFVRACLALQPHAKGI